MHDIIIILRIKKNNLFALVLDFTVFYPNEEYFDIYFALINLF